MPAGISKRKALKPMNRQASAWPNTLRSYSAAYPSSTRLGRTSPINGNRKSGLLVPTIATGSDGLELSLPYYFNLAPNLDATIRPGIISKRGVQLGGQVRYLQSNYSGEVDGDWMPNDQKSVHNNRYQSNGNTSSS